MDHSDRRRRSGRRPAERVVQARPDAAEWDEVVDVICVGARGLGLAAQTAVQTLDLSSQLVITPVKDSGSLAVRLGVNDPHTIEYLESVTDDMPAPPAVPGTGELPIRFVEGPLETADVRGTVLPTFNGTALRTWAGECLASPGGMLSTKVADQNLGVSYRGPGVNIETLPVGSVDFTAPAAMSFEDWIADWADDHVVADGDANELQRFVFDSGDVVGVVIDTSAGLRTVRARHGLVMAIGTGDQRSYWPTDGLAGVTAAEVAFVTLAASRFGRLELLVPYSEQ